MKKTIKILPFLLAIIAIFAGCSKGTTNDISMYDLWGKMKEAASFEEMNYVSSSDADAEDSFSYVSDMDYTLVSQYFIAYAKESKGNADEVVVIQTKSANDTQKAVSELNAHLEKRIATYKTYDSSQNDKLSKAIVFSSGNIAVLVVSNDNDAVKTAFNDFIKG